MAARRTLARISTAQQAPVDPRAARKREQRQKKTPHDGEAEISQLAYKRPQPIIYDPCDLRNRGLGATWDSPDIELRDSGRAVRACELRAGHDYEVVARIWNGASDAPIVGLHVSFVVAQMGIGTRQHPIGHREVTLGVKGDAPTEVTCPWTPELDGACRVHVRFCWIDDVNPGTHEGQLATAELLHSGRGSVAFEFSLRNDSEGARTYELACDAYSLSARAAASAVDPRASLATFHPPTTALNPGEETAVRLTVPDHVLGAHAALNVSALVDGETVGGFTLVS